MKMEKILICLEKKEDLKLDMLSIKQKALVDLCQVIILGDEDSIRLRVKEALDIGSSHEEILMILYWIIKNKASLQSIKYVLRALEFEESERHDYIDFVKDCKEN